jgi:hypothetical protein
MNNPDCEKCHCNGCANFCYKTCKSHSCGADRENYPYKILCREIKIREKVLFT